MKNEIDLKFIYSLTNSEIKEANSKLGLVITSMSLIKAVIGIIFSSLSISWIATLCVAAPLFLQTFIALCGMFPHKAKYKRKKSFCVENKNNYCTNFISSFKDAAEYFEHLKKYFDVFEKDKDIVEQIYKNALIIKRKIDFFNYSWLLYWPILIARKIKNFIINRNK